MTTKREPMVSVKGQAFRRLVDLVEALPVAPPAQQISIRMPLRLLQVIDRVAKYRKVSRTTVTVMLFDVMLAEAVAEGDLGLHKLLGSEAQGSGGSRKGVV